jgi:fibronectin-binding autotransporter adhesin
MKFRGGINFYRVLLSSDFLIKNRNVNPLQKFITSFKCLFVFIFLFGISSTSFSNTFLPKAVLTESNLNLPYFGPGHVNITVGTASTTGGTWFGTGTLSDPRLFTPSGTSTANILNTELATAINTYAYVKITTATSGIGTSSGTVIFSAPVNSTALSSSTFAIRKFTVTAYSTITVSSTISLTTPNVTGNDNIKSSDIEFISETGNIIISSAITTTPSASTSTNTSTYVAGGNISITSNAANGVISITSSGSLNTVGGLNSSVSPNFNINTTPGRGGDISLTGLGGITLSGNIDASSGLNYNFLKQNGVAGTLTVNTNATTITTGGSNDGQSNSAAFEIGNFTKEGTGNFKVKSLIWGGYPNLGTNYNNPNYTINNGTVTIASKNAFDEKAQIVINTGILNLGTYSVTVGSLAGTVNGTLTGGSGSLLTLQYATNDASFIKTTYDGIITGAISLYKTFPASFSKSSTQHGALVLTNSNTYTGTTTIDRGSIIITNNTALGDVSGKTIVTYGQATTDLNEKQGGTLQLVNGITVAEPINIKGIGDNNYMNGNSGSAPVSYLGAIYDSTGNNSLTGTITLDSAATIGTLITTTASSSNTFTLTSINLNGKVLTVNNNTVPVNIASGVMTGTGGLTKTGSDVLTLSSANTYSGGTTISKGTLKLGIANAIGSSSDMYFDGGNFSTAGYSVTVGNPYITNTGSTINLAGGTHT